MRVLISIQAREDAEALERAAARAGFTFREVAGVHRLEPMPQHLRICDDETVTSDGERIAGISSLLGVTDARAATGYFEGRQTVRSGTDGSRHRIGNRVRGQFRRVGR